jgi:hypothetical protein
MTPDRAALKKLAEDHAESMDRWCAAAGYETSRAYWKARAETAEKERDEAREALRDLSSRANSHVARATLHQEQKEKA